VKTLNRLDFIYPELSYKIIGACFDVFNELGFGHKEKYYQNALEVEFGSKAIRYQSQVRSNLFFKGNKVGLYYFDFLIDDKIVVELKVGSRFKKRDYEQVKSYLVQSKLKLGILVRFAEDNTTPPRILSPNYS